ncbi:MAG: prepilin-type N-terminal cleavage/methylation domain-containing protein [Thermoleophilia bacterium]
MNRDRGTTLIELVVILVILGILAGVAVPGVLVARRGVGASTGATRLALVLRHAQARACALGVRVCVSVEADGTYRLYDVASGESQGSGNLVPVALGSLGAPIVTNYPGGSIEFTPFGWPAARGGASPRAGTFTVAARHRVVVQLSGCVRCL